MAAVLTVQAVFATHDVASNGAGRELEFGSIQTGLGQNHRTVRRAKHRL